jgi:hypothetical protein
VLLKVDNLSKRAENYLKDCSEFGFLP